MTIVMRTKNGLGLGHSEKLNPAIVDYSDVASNTFSPELTYSNNVILRGYSAPRPLKKPHTKISITRVHRGVEKLMYEEKVAITSTKLKWHDLTRLLSFQANVSKRDNLLNPQRTAIKAINEAATLHAKQNAVIEAAFGLLKGKDVLPLDALQFERKMRDE